MINEKKKIIMNQPDPAAAARNGNGSPMSSLSSSASSTLHLNVGLDGAQQQRHINNIGHGNNNNTSSINNNLQPSRPHHLSPPLSQQQHQLLPQRQLQQHQSRVPFHQEEYQHQHQLQPLPLLNGIGREDAPQQHPVVPPPMPLAMMPLSPSTSHSQDEQQDLIAAPSMMLGEAMASMTLPPSIDPMSAAGGSNSGHGSGGAFSPYHLDGGHLESHPAELGRHSMSGPPSRANDDEAMNMDAVGNGHLSLGNLGHMSSLGGHNDNAEALYSPGIPTRGSRRRQSRSRPKRNEVKLNTSHGRPGNGIGNGNGYGYGGDLPGGGMSLSSNPHHDQYSIPSSRGGDIMSSSNPHDQYSIHSSSRGEGGRSHGHINDRRGLRKSDHVTGSARLNRKKRNGHGNNQHDLLLQNLQLSRSTDEYNHTNDTPTTRHMSDPISESTTGSGGLGPKHLSDPLPNGLFHQHGQLIQEDYLQPLKDLNAGRSPSLGPNHTMIDPLHENGFHHGQQPQEHSLQNHHTLGNPLGNNTMENHATMGNGKQHLILRSQNQPFLSHHSTPDMLTLDMRSFQKLEDAIVEVKLFLEDVRRLALDEGLGMNHENGGEGRKDELFVTIVTGGGEGGDTSPNGSSSSPSSSGAVLKSVLQKIFRNQNIHFIDNGESLHVNALSNVEEDDNNIMYDDENIHYAQMRMRNPPPQLEANSAGGSFHPPLSQQQRDHRHRLIPNETPSFLGDEFSSRQHDTFPRMTRQQQHNIVDHAHPPINHNGQHSVIQDENSHDAHDMLTLDMRSYRKLEDAIVEVKLFMDNIKQMALDRGLVGKGSLFITIVTGGEGSSGNVLKSVLQKIFRNQNIPFADNGDGESMRVDALSGIQDDEDEQYNQMMSNQSHTQTSNDYNLESNNNVPIAYPLDHFNNQYHSESQQPGGGRFGMPISAEDPSRSGDDRNGNFRNRSNQLPPFGVADDDGPPQPAPMPLRISQQDSSLGHRQPPQPVMPRRVELPLPRISHNGPYPQDPGAGMLYNPFDSIAHTLLQRDLSGNSSGSASSNAYYNALSGISGGGLPSTLEGERSSGAGGSGYRRQRDLPHGVDEGLENIMAVHDPAMAPPAQRLSTVSSGVVNHGPNQALLRNESRSSAVHRLLMGNPANTAEPLLAAHDSGGDIPSNLQHDNDVMHQMPMSTPAEAALRAAMLARPQSSSTGIGRIDSSQPSLHREHHSRRRNTHHSIPAQRDPATRIRRSNRRSSYNVGEIQQAITESQSSHIAHTRQQVAHDIQFRRALEIASNESNIEGGPQEPSAASACTSSPNEEQLIQMAARRSLLDEQARQDEENKKYEAELLKALRDSEEIDMVKQEEEQQQNETEADMLRKVLIQSEAERVEAMQHMQREEETLRRVMVSSLDKDAAVNEDELIKEVIRNSLDLSESEHGRRSLDGESGGPSAEETLEHILKLSVEDKEHVAEEEVEQIRKAMERSILEDRNEYAWTKRSSNI